MNKLHRALLLSCRGEGREYGSLTKEERQTLRYCLGKRFAGYGYRENVELVRITRAGEEALVAVKAPKPGRISCVNPNCGKTAPQEKHPGADEIICGACFRLCPDLRKRYRELWARRRKIERTMNRRGAGAELLPKIDFQIDANWQRIHDFFNQPERPEGLDAFLSEIGMNRDDDAEAADHPREKPPH